MGLTVGVDQSIGTDGTKKFQLKFFVSSMKNVGATGLGGLLEWAWHIRVTNVAWHIRVTNLRACYILSDESSNTLLLYE